MAIGTPWKTIPVPVTPQLTRTGPKLTGTVQVGEGAPVTAEGTVESEADAAQHNGLAADRAWPTWHGVSAAMRGPSSGVKLLESLTLTRPVWRSEQELPTGFGNSYGTRPDCVGHRGLTGGASTPVVSNGRVYHYHYNANPKSPLAFRHLHDVAGAMGKIAKLPTDQTAIATDAHRICVDDIVVAMDAVSGRTLWRTVLPMRTPNIQTHKFRGVNPTPLLDGKDLYVIGYNYRVYKLDADTGALVWEYPDTPTQSYAPFHTTAGWPLEIPFRGNGLGSPSPALAGNTVALALDGQLIGIDRRTGKELWRAGTGDGSTRLFTITMWTSRCSSGIQSWGSACAGRKAAGRRACS